jgi:hypothetical protein
MEPAELYITGMDFFITKPDIFKPGEYKEYFKNYLPEKIRKKANVANIGRIDPHDQYSNTKYIYELYKAGKIKTDLEIVELMEVVMENPNYYSYQAKVERVKGSK